MDGCRTNFTDVLAQFESCLQTACFVAVDLEMTGTKLDWDEDLEADSPLDRFYKLCRIAELYDAIQLGLTLVSNDGECSSYTFWMYREDQHYHWREDALEFLVQQNADLLAWSLDGVPYMSREEENRELAESSENGDLDRRMGLLHLWKALCRRRLPLVVHSPVDLFFLLRCFERRQLPRDLAEFAELVESCFACVLDTAYLHGGDFKHGALVPFLEEARTRHSRLAAVGCVLPCTLRLDPETEVRCGSSGSGHAHDAGWDACATAQLVAFLILLLEPKRATEGVNRLFLHRNAQCLDLGPPRSCQPAEVISALRTAVAQSLSLKGGQVAPSSAASWGTSKKDHVSDELAMAPGVLSPSSTQSTGCCSDDDKDMSSSSDSDAGDNQEISLVRLVALLKAELNSDGLYAGGGASTGVDTRLIDSCLLSNESRAENMLPSPTAADCSSRWRGVVKFLNSKGGYAFITCAETVAMFGCDVYYPRKAEMGMFAARQEVEFAIEVKANGQPHAVDVRMPRYQGVVKVVNSKDGKRHRFIACTDTFDRFDCDVYLSETEASTCTDGQEVEFAIKVDAYGRPSALEVRVLGGPCRGLPSRFCSAGSACSSSAGKESKGETQAIASASISSRGAAIVVLQ